MTNKTWPRIAVLVAILGAAGIGIRYGRMQGKAIGDAPPDEQTFDVLPAGAVRCEPVGALCITGGDSDTVAAPSAPVAGPAGESATRLRRQGVADKGASHNDAPWTLQLAGTLTHPALPGNAIVLVADVADAQAGYVTAMRQAKVPGGTAFAARLHLSPVDGVLPGRVYRVRVVQQVEHREVLLAQGDVRLE